jgi:two-component system, OmpR family, response regulator
MNLHTDIAAAEDIALIAAPDRAARPPAPASLILVIGAALAPVAEAADLRAAGVRCVCVATPEQGLDAAPSVRFDSVVLHAHGLAGQASVWLSRLRESLGCPIVLVADQADEIDEILALELGADAYLVRPLSPRRLRAHLSRLTLQWHASLGSARAAAQAWATAAAPLVLGRWQVDRARSRLCCGSTIVQLTESQTALLLCLAEARGAIVPRRQLHGTLNRRHELADRSVDVYVSRLRRLLQRCRVTDIDVLTVRGRGYALHVTQAATH